MTLPAGPSASFVERQLALLGDKQPLAVLRATPARLEAAVARLGPAGLMRSLAPGKWSGAQVLAHLTDMEIVFGYRFRQTLAEAAHALQGVAQDVWASRYSEVDAAAAVQALCGLRAWNVRMVEALTPADLERRYTHPDRGSETLTQLLRLWAGHDLNHLGQLEAL